jgi:hypothetical protein
VTEEEIRELRNHLSIFFVYFELLEEVRNCSNNDVSFRCFGCSRFMSCDNIDILMQMEDMIINEVIPSIDKLFGGDRKK